MKTRPLGDSNGSSIVESTFQPGDVVAERFRILRLINSGGMGEVYHAEDLTLHTSVALKTLLPGTGGKTENMARLVREVQLARQVTHPNVCRIFDIFRHQEEVPAGWQGAPPTFTLVSMELLDGETLTQRLARTGRLPPHRALPIVRQIAAALDTAHEVGIVHRDLKSSNVMVLLVTNGERAVVTDFGLATLDPEISELTGEPLALTKSGTVAGTPAFMAPEQVMGDKLTPAVDIYALGVLMYEMVTGRLPFLGRTHYDTATLRLRKLPRPPCEMVPNLDPRWDAAILRCLERDPEKRFGSCREILDALEGEIPAQPWSWRRRTALAAAVGLPLLVLLLTFTGRLSTPDPERPAGSAAAESRRSVAVLGFKNLSGGDGATWLDDAISEMLTVELAGGGGLRVVPYETVRRLRPALADVSALPPETFPRIGSQLGSDLVVLGSYFAGEEEGGPLRLDLRLLEVETGDLVAGVSETGTRETLPDLVERAAGRLRVALGAGSRASRPTDRLRAFLPVSPEAARLYAEGMESLRRFDVTAARELLERSAELEASAPLTHSTLAAAWQALGYDENAVAAARRGHELARDLPREGRLVAEGRFRVAGGEWSRAVEIYGTLWEFYPDQVEYALSLVAARTAAGQGEEALATLEGLLRLHPSAADEPRVDLAEGKAAYELSQFERSAAARSRAVEKGRKLGQEPLLARALVEHGLALYRLGQHPQALTAAAEARRTFVELGDRGGMADAMKLRGDVLLVQGDLQQASSTYGEALAIYRELGNRAGPVRALNNLGAVLQFQGDLDGALVRYEEALALADTIGDRALPARLNVGLILQTQGDLDGARRRFEEVLPIARDTGDRSRLAHGLANLTSVLVSQGDLDGAEARNDEAIAIWQETSDQRSLSHAQENRGDLLVQRGQLAAARTVYEGLLATLERLRDESALANVRLSLARLAIEEGRPEDAEPLARRSLEGYLEQERLNGEARASAVLAWTLVLQGRDEEATEPLARALELLAGSQEVDLGFSVHLLAARVRAAQGRAEEATEELEKVISEARARGFVDVELEARLALAEIGSADALRLEELESEARAMGFGLIARKSRKALEAREARER